MVGTRGVRIIVREKIFPAAFTDTLEASFVVFYGRTISRGIHRLLCGRSCGNGVWILLIEIFHRFYFLCMSLNRLFGDGDRWGRRELDFGIFRRVHTCRTAHNSFELLPIVHHFLSTAGPTFFRVVKDGRRNVVRARTRGVVGGVEHFLAAVVSASY